MNAANDTTRSLASALTDLSLAGFVIVHTPIELVSSVTQTLVAQIASSRSELGAHWSPTEKVNILTAGPERYVARMKLAYAAIFPATSAIEIEVHVLGSLPEFNFASQEGTAAWSSLLKTEKHKNEWWVINHDRDAAKSNAMFLSNLARLKSMARKTGANVLLVLSMNERVEESRLDLLCDELIVVHECDPDIYGGVSYAFDTLGLRDFNDLGFGKVMCSVKPILQSHFVRKFEPLIALKLLDRAIRTMRGNGSSLSEIGTFVRRNKSTVQRRLEGWEVRAVAVPVDWMEKMKEALEAQADKHVFIETRKPSSHVDMDSMDDEDESAAHIDEPDDYDGD